MAERTISELEAAANSLRIGEALDLTPLEQRLWLDYQGYKARLGAAQEAASDYERRVRFLEKERSYLLNERENSLRRLPLPDATVTRLRVRSIDVLLSMTVSQLRDLENVGPRTIKRLVDWAERAGVKAAFLPDQPEALHGKAFPWAHLQDAA